MRAQTATHKHTLDWVIHACWCHHRSSGETERSTRGLTSELWTLRPNICLLTFSHQYMFVYIFSRINPGTDKRENSSHVQEQCNILLCRLKQCMHLELRAVLFNTCSVKKKKAYCASHVKKSKCFWLPSLREGRREMGWERKPLSLFPSLCFLPYFLPC